MAGDCMQSGALGASREDAVHRTTAMQSGSPHSEPLRCSPGRPPRYQRRGQSDRTILHVASNFVFTPSAWSVPTLILVHCIKSAKAKSRHFRWSPSSRAGAPTRAVPHVTLRASTTRPDHSALRRSPSSLFVEIVLRRSGARSSALFCTGRNTPRR